YGVNSILYQRGLYPEDMFTRVVDFGVPLMVTTVKEISDYLDQHSKYIEEWLEKLTLQKLVVLIRSVDTGDIMERWQFNVECDKTATHNTIKEKTEADVRKEIQHVMRNILSANALLPIYDCPCSFEILIYTDKSQAVPETWKITEAGIIDNSLELRLKSYDTTIHKVSTSVAYKKLD
ncbi:hypothetical protein HELRODRAFT_68763, partial [Helobdella robusta]|uniref:HORMA domain-containing protein n=1 Tax=Helobdella robusta TaxID=6412 RepID=T1FZJ4_HELRO